MLPAVSDDLGEDSASRDTKLHNPNPHPVQNGLFLARAVNQRLLPPTNGGPVRSRTNLVNVRTAGNNSSVDVHEGHLTHSDSSVSGSRLYPSAGHHRPPSSGLIGSVVHRRPASPEIACRRISTAVSRLRSNPHGWGTASLGTSSEDASGVEIAVETAKTLSSTTGISQCSRGSTPRRTGRFSCFCRDLLGRAIRCSSDRIGRCSELLRSQGGHRIVTQRSHAAVA